MALTDNDIDELAGEREVKSGELVDPSRNYQPISGGLFDSKIFGEQRCFHRSVKVWTEHGMRSIGEIVNKLLPIRVWTFNLDLNEFELKPISNWVRSSSPSGIGVSRFVPPIGRFGGTCPRFNPTTLWGTRTHPVLNSRGVEVGLANANMLLAATETFSYSQRQLLYGSLLGDGHVNDSGYYVEKHCVRQKEYLEFKQCILKPLCRMRNKDIC